VDAFQRQISALRHQLGGELDPPGPMVTELPALPREDYSSRFELSRYEPEPDERTIVRPEPQAPLAPATSLLPAVPAIDDLTSVLSHTTTWTGNLDSTGSLHIHGKVDGSLTARDQIYVAEEAEVDASMQATTVTIAGSVRGSVLCSERFEVLPRGKFAGDVQAPVVVIHEGALVSGDIAMGALGESSRGRPPARVARGGD
jgi:cytoskeletal protein CcmA (bactofilin family)